MTYWLDLFTGTTWDEFRNAGANVSGFRHRMRGTAKKIQPGDIFLCYLTGVMRWVGALEVVGVSNDKRAIWADDKFPVRFDVKPLVMLHAEYGAPMGQLEGKVDFFQTLKHRGGFKGFLRMSPNAFKRQSDGDLILSLLRDAEKTPVAVPVDPRKLARRPRYFKVDFKKGKVAVPTVVSVPEAEEEELAPTPTEQKPTESATRHTEIQYHLLKLGAELGLDVWVARNDRSRVFGGQLLGSMENILNELPTQFNEATNRTIELIDVLWLKGNSIVSAFEIESTTSVYSGLLRMSDLLALQPNLDIQLYLVAPDERRAKVQQEIARPTFAYREKPLGRICGFVGFAKLMEKVEGVRKLGLAAAMKPDSLMKATAEYLYRTRRGFVEHTHDSPTATCVVLNGRPRFVQISRRLCPSTQHVAQSMSGPLPGPPRRYSLRVERRSPDVSGGMSARNSLSMRIRGRGRLAGMWARIARRCT